MRILRASGSVIDPRGSPLGLRPPVYSTWRFASTALRAASAALTRSFTLAHGTLACGLRTRAQGRILGQLLDRFDLRTRRPEILLELLLAPKRSRPRTGSHPQTVLRHARQIDQPALHQYR